MIESHKNMDNNDGSVRESELHGAINMSMTPSDIPSIVSSTQEHRTRREATPQPAEIDVEDGFSKSMHDRQEKEDKIVTWDGDDDPRNPKNFTFARKWLIVATTCAMTFCITFASSIFTSAIPSVSEEFGVSREVMLLGVAVFVLGFAAGPLIWGPLSEAHGRTRPLFTGLVIFSIFQIPVAVAHNLETIFVCRFFQAAFGAAPIGILGGLFVDILQPIELGIAVSIFAAVVFAGPAVGPIAGSFITESYLGWRWTSWITLIISIIFTALAWLATPETFAPLLLRQKAQILRYSTKNWALHAQSEEQELDLNVLITKYLTRPIRMIVLEPILLILTIYTAFVYGILYLTFVAYPYSFEVDRGWSPGVASLPFASMLIGIILAAIMLAIFTKTWYHKRYTSAKRLVPEDRLPPMILGSLVLPIGLFWFAWTSSPSMHWAPQVVSGVFIGGGIILIFMPAILYIIDVYLAIANSAIAINSFFRALFGAGFPMFAPQMYERLHVNWATSTLGFICVALIPFPMLFWIYGQKLRRWSKFAIEM